MDIAILSYAIIGILLAMDAFTCFTKKNGLDPGMAKKFTQESIEKFSIVVGICNVIGVLFAVFFGLAIQGIIDPGFDAGGVSAVAWIWRAVWAAVVIVPHLIARKFILVPLKK